MSKFWICFEGRDSRIWIWDMKEKESKMPRVLAWAIVRMMFPWIEIEEAEGEQVWGWGRSGRYGYVKPEVSLKYPSRDVEEAIGYKK